MSKLQEIIERLVGCTSHLDFYDLEKAKVCVREAYTSGVEDGYASATLPLSNDATANTHVISDLLEQVKKFLDSYGLAPRFSTLKGVVEQAFMKGTTVGFKANLDGTTTDTLIREVHKRGVYMVALGEPKERGMTMQEALLLAKDEGVEVRGINYRKNACVKYLRDEGFVLFNKKVNIGKFQVDHDDLTSEWEVYTPPPERKDGDEQELYHAGFTVPANDYACDLRRHIEGTATIELTPKTTGLTFTEAMQAVESGEEVMRDFWSVDTLIKGHNIISWKEEGRPYSPTFAELKASDWCIIPKEPQVTYVSFEEAIAAVKQGKSARRMPWDSQIYIAKSLKAGAYKGGGCHNLLRKSQQT